MAGLDNYSGQPQPQSQSQLQPQLQSRRDGVGCGDQHASNTSRQHACYVCPTCLATILGPLVAVLRSKDTDPASLNYSPCLADGPAAATEGTPVANSSTNGVHAAPLKLVDEPAARDQALEQDDQVESDILPNIITPEVSPVGQINLAEPTDPTSSSTHSVVIFSSQEGTSALERIKPWGLSDLAINNSKRKSRAEPKLMVPKKPKDPNAPKQPAPAYIVYQNQVRPAMKDRFPNHSPVELVKEISQSWKQLPYPERQRYKDEARLKFAQWSEDQIAYSQAAIANMDGQSSGSSIREQSSNSLGYLDVGGSRTEGQPTPKCRRTQSGSAED